MIEPQFVLTRPDGSQVPASESGLSENDQRAISLVLLWMKRWTLLCWSVRAWFVLFLTSIGGSWAFRIWELEAEIKLSDTISDTIFDVFTLMGPAWVVLFIFSDIIWIDHNIRTKTTAEQILSGLVAVERSLIISIPLMVIEYLARIYYADLGWGFKALGFVHTLVCMHAGVEVTSICYSSRKILERIDQAMRAICARKRVTGRPCTCLRCRPISAAQVA